MNYTPEQFTQAVLKALETLNTPDVTKLSIQERKDLALNPNTPPETLTLLARDEDLSVRCRVALNPNTPTETLTILARDEDWGVRWSVAWNPNTPSESLVILAQDEDDDVRNGATQNPNYNPAKELKVTAKQYEALKKLLAASQDEDLKSIQF
jgi:hypothetical protein